jgi:lipopolysaccharide export system protein LptC
MKSADRIGQFISVGLFLILAIASWGLTEYLQRGRMMSAPTDAAGPNAIIENPKIVRSDPTGQPQYRLEAVSIVHSERGDRSEIERPVVSSLSANKPLTVVRAQTAIATDQLNRIDLQGNVLITRAAQGDQPAARIETERATLLIKEERAVSDAAVLISRGTSTLQGVGMVFDQKTQKIEITADSRMIVPREKR